MVNYWRNAIVLLRQSGCDTTDVYQRKFLESVYSCLQWVIVKHDADLYPDKPDGTQISLNTEVVNSMLFEIQTHFEQLLEEESVSGYFSTILLPADGELFRRVTELYSSNLTEDEIIDVIRNDSDFNNLKRESPLFLIIRAILAKEDFLPIMKNMIGNHDISSVSDNANRPKAINDFISGFHRLIMANINIGTSSMVALNTDTRTLN